MQLNLSNYLPGKTYQIEEDVDLSKIIFPIDSRIKSITNLHVNININRYGDIYDLYIFGKGEIQAICSYTLQQFTYPFSFEERISLGDDDFPLDSNRVDLDPFFIAFISDVIPLNIHKPGACRPSNGDSYRVLSEEELEQERKSRPDPRFAILDDIEI